MLALRGLFKIKGDSLGPVHFYVRIHGHCFHVSSWLCRIGIGQRGKRRSGVYVLVASGTGATHRIDPQIPRIARAIQINDFLFVRQAEFLESDVRPVRPGTGVVGVQRDVGGCCTVGGGAIGGGGCCGHGVGLPRVWGC